MVEDAFIFKVDVLFQHLFKKLKSRGFVKCCLSDGDDVSSATGLGKPRTLRRPGHGEHAVAHICMHQMRRGVGIVVNDLIDCGWGPITKRSRYVNCYCDEKTGSHVLDFIAGIGGGDRVVRRMLEISLQAIFLDAPHYFISPINLKKKEIMAISNIDIIYVKQVINIGARIVNFDKR